jgi:hypothetical protein
VKKLSTLALIAALGVWSSAPATIIQGNSLQNTLTAAGAVVNVNTDQYNPDEVWQVGATGLAGSRLLFELAGFANSNAFGVYDVTNPGRYLTIFQGAHSPGRQGLLTMNDGLFCAGVVWGSPTCRSFGSNFFGFFLSTPNGVFRSEEWRNADGQDHMVAFEGGRGRGNVGGSPWLAGEFILAWEDLWGGGDHDYDDFGVLVESVVSVAEPATLALFGLGLIAIVYVRRRRIRVRS